jgi:virulence-associated protein VapD
MEKTLSDENVIVNYYNTILQIYTQKQPIELDKARFDEFVGSLYIVKPVAESLFCEIKEYLLQKLNLDKFAQCHKEILRIKINPIYAQQLRERIQQDI